VRITLQQTAWQGNALSTLLSEWVHDTNDPLIDFQLFFNRSANMNA